MAGLATGRMAKRSRRVKPGPASGVIWSRERQRKASRAAGGGKLRNGWQQTMTFERDLAFDLDMRRIVAHVTLGLARFFQEQLERGERPSGFGALPEVLRELPRGTKGPRRKQHVGYRTGYMAEHWYLGPVRGGVFSATRLLKPYGGSGGADHRNEARDLVLNVLLDRGIDFQSVRGKAAGVIGKLFQEAVGASFGDVTLEERYSRNEGLLPTFRGEGGDP